MMITDQDLHPIEWVFVGALAGVADAADVALWTLVQYFVILEI